MLKIDPAFVAQIEAATEPEELYGLVQNAIELEHSTIPTYLAAYFTLKPGTNQVVAQILRSIVVQEMLHMAIACNLLIAIGGRPVIDKPGFIPTYPGPLPMGIENDLIVPIEKCSLGLVKNVFMTIEEPEDPITINALRATTDSFRTIGEFYAALDACLRRMGPKAFRKGRLDEEMVNNTWFPADQLFRIVDEDTASAAIRLIVRQGEGTTLDPLDPEDQPAHYYRFEQIVKGRLLVRDPSTPSGFAFKGAPVALDVEDVWNMQPNPPEPVVLPPGSAARRASSIFAFGYTSLLRGLHATFNGAPNAMSRAMGQMYQLRLNAQNVLQTPLPHQAHVSTGLSFVYEPELV